MWMIWKHRNDVVFNGILPSIPSLKHGIREEGVAWTNLGLLGKLAHEEAEDRWTA